MTNDQLIKLFVATKGKKEAYANNLRIDGNKLFSYQTCIAEFDENDNLLVSKDNFSNTTARHLFLLRKNNNSFNEYPLPAKREQKAFDAKNALVELGASLEKLNIKRKKERLEFVETYEGLNKLKSVARFEPFMTDIDSILQANEETYNALTK